MVGPKITQTLKSMGIHKIEQLQQMSMQYLMQIFGKNGYLIWERARGIDSQPIITQSSKKSISKEYTYEEDVHCKNILEKKLDEMVEVLYLELRQTGYFTGAITVKIRYQNFETVSKQSKVSFTCDEHHIRTQARFLLKALLDPERSVRLIGLRCSNLTSGSYQLDLFNQDISALNATMARSKVIEKLTPSI